MEVLTQVGGSILGLLLMRREESINGASIMAIDFQTLKAEAQKRIVTFLEVTDNIQKSDLFKDGLFALKLNLKIDVTRDTIEEELSRPLEKDTRDALLDIRKLLLKDGDAYFFKVYNSMRTSIPSNSPALQALDQIRENFSDTLQGKNSSVNISLSYSRQDGNYEKHFTPEEIIGLWFNSVYFHTDYDKKEVLVNLLQSIGQPVVFTFLETIRSIVRCSLQMASLAHHEFKNID
jgi:hypothetical protein